MTSASTFETPLIVEPSALETPDNDATHSVIWLHGLGADGYDFEPIVPQLGTERTRFIFPHAPQRAVTINAGMRMRAWYDITGVSLEARTDTAGITASVELLHELIDQQIATGIASSNIVLAGFSQGGVIAIHGALRYPKPLGGLIALSTYLPLTDELQQALTTSHNLQLTAFVAHGTQDPMVTPDLGRAACEQLTAWGLNAAFHTYPMPHAICPEEIADIAAWLKALGE